MTQPKYAPIPIEDEVRPGYRLGVPSRWIPDRPGEGPPGSLRSPGVRPSTEGRGIPGPDQGYALRLAARFSDRLVLEAGERAEDVLAGAVAIALRRSALFGRAPVSADLEVALGLFGYLSPAPDKLVGLRKKLFAGLSHDYWSCRELAHRLASSTLEMPVRDASIRDDWEQLLNA